MSRDDLMPVFAIAGDRDGRTFGSLTEAKAAMEADRQEAWRRLQERIRLEREFAARCGEELARKRWEDKRAGIEAVLAEARPGPGQAEATMHQAIDAGHFEEALTAALRLVALPVVLEVAEAMFAQHKAARPALLDVRGEPG